MTGKRETDGSWIESQLKRTEARIERLKKCPPQGEDVSASAAADDAVAMNPEKGLHRLSELSLSLEYLDLIIVFSSWEEEWNQKKNFPLIGGDTSLSDCVKLSSLLLRFPPLNAISKSFERLRQVIWNRYMYIFTTTRGALSTQIQHSLRDIGFPISPSDALIHYFFEGNDELEGDLARCCTQLVALQTIHEHFMVASSTATSRQHAPWQRLDVVTELCRPIAIRVRYHFTSSSNEFCSQTKMEFSNRYDRLVEWLLSFMRESMRTPLELIRTYFDDIARRGWKQAIEMLSSSSGNATNSCQLPPATHVFQYFLREMVLLVRHVLQGGDQHDTKATLSQQRNTSTTSLCTIVSDDVLFSTSMEQMFRFDEHILNESTQISSVEAAVLNSDNMLHKLMLPSIPRLTGVITYYPDRFYRWVEIEHDTAMHILSSVPLPEMDRHQIHKTQSEMIADLTFPAFVETLVSLLNSAHDKCQVAFSPFGKFHTQYVVLLERHPTSGYHLAEYLNRVQVPLIVSYLDATLAWTKQQVRRILNCVQRLLCPAPSKSWSSYASSAMSSSDQAPTKEVMMCLVQDYCKMAGGTTCISLLLLAQALHWENIEMRHDFSSHLITSKEISASSIFKQMNDSVSRVSKAMVDELASSIAESMVVDDARVASYLMTIHYILEEECNNDFGDAAKRLQNTQVSESHANSWDRALPSQCRSLDISPDLVDFLPTLCDVVNTFNKITYDPRSEVVIAADILRSNLAHGLSLKLIEVILDVPEICCTQGGLQVNVDIQAIAEVFSLPSRLQLSNLRYDGSFDRLLDIVKLMTLEYQPFLSLRMAFSDLAGCQHDDTGDYAEVDIILENLMSDGKSMEQARDMLRAKGFVSLDLRDALVVLYRRNG